MNVRSVRRHPDERPLLDPRFEIPLEMLVDPRFEIPLEMLVDPF